VGEDRWAGPVMRSHSGVTGRVLDFYDKKWRKNNRGKNICMPPSHVSGLRPAVHGPRVPFSLQQNGQWRRLNRWP
jgi:hypothetical protein